MSVRALERIARDGKIAFAAFGAMALQWEAVVLLLLRLSRFLDELTFSYAASPMVSRRSSPAYEALVPVH
jgi:hypothetical protein